jgi:hypothetical protein
MSFSFVNYAGQSTNPLEQAINAYIAMTKNRGQQLENIYSAEKNKWAPLTLPAEAISKIAYSNAVLPQAYAKFIENPQIGPNIPDEAKNAFVKNLQTLMGNTGYGVNPTGAGQSNQVQALAEAYRRLYQSQPGTQGNTPQQQVANALTQSQPTQTINQPGQSADQYSENKPTWAENIANQKSLEAEGAELGKARGQAISELGKEYRQDAEAIVPLDRMVQLIKTPEFQQMKSTIPFYQDLQMKGLSKIGDRNLQKMIGDYIIDSRSAIANTVNTFKGRAMAKEFDFANTMKVNDNDTLGVIIGKLESLLTFKTATMQRNDIAANLMEKYHYNEGKAYKLANEQVDMDKIRSNIESRLSLAPDTISVYRNGKEYRIPKEHQEQALSEGFTLHR